jgi:hypothetical protein
MGSAPDDPWKQMFEQARAQASTTPEWGAAEAYAFVRRSDHKIWNEKQWKAHYAHLQPKVNILDTVMKKRGYITKFEKLVFEPGAPAEIDGIAYNLWRPSGIEAVPGDVTWFTGGVTLPFALAELLADGLAPLLERHRRTTADVEIEVDAVLHDLAFGHLLEEEPRTDAVGILQRVGVVPVILGDARVAQEVLPACVRGWWRGGLVVQGLLPE